MPKIWVGILIVASMLNAQTSVVNIATDSCEVYIGRGINHYAHMLTTDIQPGTEGWLGNPHPIGWCELCQKSHTRESCIEKFSEDFYQKVQTDTTFRNYLILQRGKILGCYCKPKPCHGDIIKAWLDEQE